jgi:hypothetical protein
MKWFSRVSYAIASKRFPKRKNNSSVQSDYDEVGEYLSPKALVKLNDLMNNLNNKDENEE